MAGNAESNQALKQLRGDTFESVFSLSVPLFQDRAHLLWSQAVCTLLSDLLPAIVPVFIEICSSKNRADREYLGTPKTGLEKESDKRGKNISYRVSISDFPLSISIYF